MRTELIPVDIDGVRAFVSVVAENGEAEVGPRAAVDLRSAFQASAGAVRIAREAIAELEWDRATISLGVEFGIESGSLVAIIGKASAKSNISIELEFSRADGSRL